MPQNHEFQEWWNKQRQFLDNSEPTPFLTLDISTPTTPTPVSHHRKPRTARQISWLFLLKLQHLFASISWLASSFLHLLATANRRIAADKSSSASSQSRLYRVIKGFLFVVIVLLGLELVAYYKGWHFSPPSMGSAVERGYAWWLEIRVKYLAPPLQSLANVCIVLFLIQSVDRAVLVLGCFWIKMRRIRPVAAVEYGGQMSVEEYPMVLVQIPMCNEREVSAM